MRNVYTPVIECECLSKEGMSLQIADSYQSKQNFSNRPQLNNILWLQSNLGEASLEIHSLSFGRPLPTKLYLWCIHDALIHDVCIQESWTRIHVSLMPVSMTHISMILDPWFRCFAWDALSCIDHVVLLSNLEQPISINQLLELPCPSVRSLVTKFAAS